MNTVIKHVSSYLPGDREENVKFSHRFLNMDLNPNLIKTIFGSEGRYIAGKEIQCSDLATNAANIFLNKSNKSEIDLLIFASASGDLIEPATSNIVQYKLGLSCPVMDIKNACNSFVTSIQVASSFINQGIYKNILIVAGEKLSNTIRFGAKNQEEMKHNLAALSFGDAGAAMWLTGSLDQSGIIYQSFLSLGEYWELSTVPGGGSMHPFDADKHYFHGQTSELINTLQHGKAKTFIQNCIIESPWEIEELDLIITHQVATPIYNVIAKSVGIPLDKIHQVFHKYGNTAAASIPIALKDAMDNGKAKPGDKIMLLGLGAGISVSVQMLVL